MEVSVGYQSLHLPGNWVPAGFNIDVGAPVKGVWSVAGEVGMVHKNEFDGIGGSPLNIFNFGVGPRVSWHSEHVVPFAQLIAGAEHTTGPSADTTFMLQPGAGVYVPAGARWGVVAQADYRPVFFEGNTDNQFRVVFGVRVR
jgi:hypothetical protein